MESCRSTALAVMVNRWNYSMSRKNNQLTVRFYFGFFAPLFDLTPVFLENAEQLRRTHPDECLAGRTIRSYTDGVIDSHTAAMPEPYSDDPKLSGQLNRAPANYTRAAAELDRRGFQIFTHSIGDKGARQ
jgi:predicted amidohydrolase YtcJ